MDLEEQKLNQTLIDSQNSWRLRVMEEIKKQWWLAGPLIIDSLLQYSIQVISVMFVGHLGDFSLAAASMATSFASVTGLSLLIGTGSTLDTLCGQAYGAQQNHMLGIHLQRATMVLFFMSLPIAVIWAKTEQILVMFGQDEEISKGAGVYACSMIPMVFSFGLLQCLFRFLQTQNIVIPVMIISGVTTLLHFPLCWFLVFKSGLGNTGAALASSITSWVNVLLLVLYVKFSPACEDSWTGISEVNLQEALKFLKLAIPSASMICLEFCSFEVVILVAGILPNPQVETSVMSIVMTTSAILFNISYGLGSAASIRVSNELGAGLPQAACLTAYVAVLMTTVVGMILCVIFILLLRDAWGRLFSNETETLRYISAMMPLLAVTNFLDGIQCVLSGVVRGCGRQKIGALINLGAYYLVGIPCAIMFAFPLKIGGKGLWMGMTSAIFVQMVSLLFVTLQTNWGQEVKKAADRARI
ncbi:Multi antimicrobial extrusion protein [Dillenia turbinata]|uniref:Protein DETOXIFICATION n=1 Tax=Dillenia turbinata TaxID=194707 RepID=A0AAN8Z5D4_9MAGN